MTLAGLRNLDFLYSFYTLILNEVSKKELLYDKKLKILQRKTYQICCFDHDKVKISKNSDIFGLIKGSYFDARSGGLILICHCSYHFLLDNLSEVLSTKNYAL